MSFVFVTTELAPLTRGGAGAVIAGLSERLRADGDRVRVVIVRDAEAPTLAVSGDVRIVVVDPRIDGPETDARGRFLARARAAARAVAEEVRDLERAAVEFVDFDGLGYWALTHREELGLGRVPITVRFHGPVDLMWEATGHGHAEWETVREMERASFALADRVLVPASGHAPVVADRYGVPAERIAVAPPPVPELGRVGRRPHVEPTLTVVGRLGEVKGSHDMVDAVLQLLPEHPELTVRFVGDDGWSAAEGRPMREALTARIPASLADRIVFTGPLERGELAAELAAAWAVVVPSRFESFCLAAHEARRAGLPVVVPDLPAFADLFAESTGALVYDGTVPGLIAAVGRLLRDPALRDRLAAAPPPAPGDPLSAYRLPSPVPRHPRVQAGLATAAVKRVEATLPAAASGRAARIAGRLLRITPTPVARAAVRLLPQGAKDRFRALADWRVEAERRQLEDARAELRRRIAAGGFPDEAHPDVTVVIPCHDQGEFVQDAIWSVFSQTHPSWEIVVVDDGSGDPGTIATLDALDLPRVTVVRQANRGLPGARNAGIAAARGRFIVPLDADDELAPDFLQVLLTAIEPHPEAAYAHCWAELFGDQSAIWVTRPFNDYQILLSNSVVGCVLLRREAVDAVAGYAEDMVRGNEDWDLWLRLLAAGWGQVEVHRALFRYRKHGISMSVETEARYEEARAAMPSRHPSLYADRPVRRRKREHYPWVTLMLPDATQPTFLDQTIDDLEIVPLAPLPPAIVAAAERRGWVVRPPATDVFDAVRLARGKVVVDWSGVTAADPGAVVRLARVLEDPRDAVGAVPTDWPASDPLAWRRWALVDRDGPGGPPLAVDLSVHADGREPMLHPGMCPLPGWDVRDELADVELPIARQPPEEDGPVPAWISGGR